MKGILMKWILVFLVIFKYNHAFAFLDKVLDQTDKVMSVVYTLEALDELLNEISDSETERSRKISELRDSAQALQSELYEMEYSKEEVEYIMGPFSDFDSLEYRIRAITNRIRTIKRLKTKLVALLGGASGSSNTAQAVVSNETNKILREIQRDEAQDKLDRDRRELMNIRLQNLYAKKRKQALDKNYVSIQKDSKKRGLANFSPFKVVSKSVSVN